MSCWRRAARAVAAVGVAAISLSAPTSTPAASAAPAPVAAGAPVRMTVVGQTTFVDANGNFFAGVKVTGAPVGSEAVVTIHDRLVDRSAFDESLPDGGLGLATFPVIPLDQQPVDAHGTRTVSVLIPLRGPGGPRRPGAYYIGKAGVYPIRIAVRDADGNELGHLVTHLVRLPEADQVQDPSTRLRVAPLFAVHAPPARQPNGRGRRPAAAIAEISTLVNALAAHPKVAATIDPTPETLEFLGASTSADATLLRRLNTQAQAAQRQILSSTYVDLDPSSWVSDSLLGPFNHQRQRGTAAVTEALGRPDTGTWVGGDDLTAAALSRLRDSGVDQVVVPEQALTPVEPRRFPDDVTQPFKVNSDSGVPTPTLQIDDRLRASFANTQDPVLGAHQLLAQLAVIAFAQGGTPGAVVLDPPPAWHPSATFLKELFSGLATDNPLMVSSTLDQVFASVPPAGTNGSAALQLDDRGGDLVRMLAPKSATPLGEYSLRLTETQAALSAFGSMVGPRNPTVSDFNDRIDVSASNDLKPAQKLEYLDAVSAELDRRFAAVSAPPKEKVTLAASDATFPLTLHSSLPYPVKVVVQLDASNRLTFPDGDRIVVTLRGQRTRLKLHVRAVSGDTPLRVTVLSADGSQILPNATTRYTVRSTAVSGVGLVLTAGAALFLLVWWGRHWRRARRSARAGKHAAVTPA